MSLTNGCYKIISVWDTLCLGPQVSSYSIAYSKATLDSDNDEVAQKWYVTQGTEVTGSNIINNCDTINDNLYLECSEEAITGNDVYLNVTGTAWTRRCRNIYVWRCFYNNIQHFFSGFIFR